MIFSSEKQIWILSVWIVVANARQINKREIIELVDNKRVNTTAARFVDDGCFEWMCKENEVCNEYGFCVCNEPFARYNYETDQCEECGCKFCDKYIINKYEDLIYFNSGWTFMYIMLRIR